MKPQSTTPALDKKLHQASRTIGRADTAIASHEKKRTKAWELFIETADKVDPKFRFLADDGHYMTLQWREGKVRRNDPLLRQKLQALCQDAEFRAAHFQPSEGEPPFTADEAFWNVWDSITDQTVNSDKLEAAYQAGVIPAEVLQETIVVPDPTYARIRQPWTKDDGNRAVIYGVTKR